MAVLTTDALPKYDPNDLPATVKKLHDYTTSLTEMLRFVLMNLDEDNVQGLDTLNREMQDAQGNLSQIQQTAQGILTRVENAEGDLSTVLQTADQLTTRVQNAEGTEFVSCGSPVHRRTGWLRRRLGRKQRQRFGYCI